MFEAATIGSVRRATSSIVACLFIVKVRGVLRLV